MMKQSLNILLAAATLTLTTAVYAAGHGYHGKHGDCHGGKYGMHRSNLVEKLDLSADQKTAIDEIRNAAREQHKANRATRMNERWAMMDLNPDDPDYTSRVAELAKQKAAQVEQRMIARGAKKAQIHAILTLEQREKLVQLKADKRAQFVKHHRRDNVDNE